VECSTSGHSIILLLGNPFSCKQERILSPTVLSERPWFSYRIEQDYGHREAVAELDQFILAL